MREKNIKTTLCKIIRLYNPEEIAKALLFRMVLYNCLQITGEEVNPLLYDRSKACPICGMGRIQQADLGIPPSKLLHFDI